MGTQYTEVFVINIPSDSEFSDYSSGPALSIFRGDGSRISLKVFYLAEELKSIDRDIVIPSGPDDPDMILDATIWFFPQWFRSCKNYAKVAKEIGDKRFLDLDFNMPSNWKELRKESRQLFAKLEVQRGMLVFEDKKVPRTNDGDKNQF